MWPFVVRGSLCIHCAKACCSVLAGGTSWRQGHCSSVSEALLEGSSLYTPKMTHRWHGELEAARNSETEEKYRRYAATLEAHLAGCQQILDKVRAASYSRFCWLSCSTQ